MIPASRILRLSRADLFFQLGNRAFCIFQPGTPTVSDHSSATPRVFSFAQLHWRNRRRTITAFLTTTGERISGTWSFAEGGQPDEARVSSRRDRNVGQCSVRSAEGQVPPCPCSP